MIDADSIQRNSVLLIGGPDAGKSNFLFRVWIALTNGGLIVSDGLPKEVQYLRAGAERLLEGEFAGRTSDEGQEQVFIPFVVTGAAGEGRHGILAVPDVPGEEILAVYRNRKWSRVWEDQISNRCGSLLFIRAGSDEVVAPLDWATCHEKYGGTFPAAPSSNGEEVNHLEANDSTEAQLSATAGEMPDDETQQNDPPTQVVLTEWLQFLRQAFTEIVGGEFRPRVGIVVSAWDAVPVEQREDSPAKYVCENFPLLYQFIESNSESFDCKFFGVSIVSGDLKNDEDFKQTYANGTPQNFGYVVHSLGKELDRSQDITLPIVWAMKLPSTFQK